MTSQRHFKLSVVAGATTTILIAGQCFAQVTNQIVGSPIEGVLITSNSDATGGEFFQITEGSRNVLFSPGNGTTVQIGQSGTATTVSGSLTIVEGLNNNGGGISNAGAISGATTINASGTVTGGALSVSNNAAVGGTLSVGGTMTTSGITNTGNITNSANLATATLNTSGAATVGNGLTVSAGGANVTGNSSVNGTFAVSGATSLGNTLTVTGASTLNGGAIINNGATIYSGPTTGNSLTVGPNQTTTVGINSVTYGTSITGGMLVDGDLGVNGNIYSLNPTANASVNVGNNGLTITGTTNFVGLISDNNATAGDGHAQLSMITDDTTGKASASLMVTNPQGIAHGISIDENGTNQTVVSGGTQSTTLTLDDNGARFTNTVTGGPARVTGVADGKSRYDAVNFGQLRRVYGGIASAAALAGIPDAAAGKLYTVGVGVGRFQGEYALGVGFRGTVAQNIRVTAGMAHSNSATTLQAGAGFSW